MHTIYFLFFKFSEKTVLKSFIKLFYVLDKE